MVNDVVLNYIKTNKGKFSEEDIRVKILSRGYLEADVDEAFRVLGDKEIVSNKVENKRSVVQKKGGFKWMKMAGVIGIVFFILMFVNFVLGLVGIEGLPINSGIWMEYIGIAILLLMAVAICFYYCGFVKLGKYANSKLIKVSSIVFVIFSALLFLLFVGVSFLSVFAFPSMNSMMSGGSSGFIYVFFGLILTMVVFRYLFVIGLIRIRGAVKFSLVAGILGLIGVIVVTLFAAYVIYLSFNPDAVIGLIRFNFLVFIVWAGYSLNILILVVLLFESLVLLSGSKKFE